MLVGVVSIRNIEPRQSAVRANMQSIAWSVTRAAEVYRRDKNTEPTVDDLLGSMLVSPDLLVKYSRAEIVGETGVVPLIVQTEPCRAVKRGESWGGIEETIDHDLPACRYVLMSDWAVVQIDEPEYQRVWASKVRLVPFK